MLLKELKNIFHLELDQQYGVEEVDQFFYRTLEHYFDISKLFVALNPTLSLTNDEVPIVYKTLESLKNNIPIQQILGKTSFYGFDFFVTKDVLIPRPETEELVEWILKDIKNKKIKKSPIKILDVGTGSGCIAVTIAKNTASVEVTAYDISEKALEIAKKNAKNLQVPINFIQADILKIQDLPDKYDIIVSNPPYVREVEKNQMMLNVLDYEPHIALFVPDDDALLFYKKIAQLAVNNLQPDGALYFEINQYLGDELEEELRALGFLNIKRRKDLFSNERMVKAQLIKSV
ncbi:peptide chain release factor N(5)-glutamine methyltransferase [Ascidiimonas sp. W6]|uniref:peptide chain release factor N(5)-glutamine methyltransferase n=1 Tax=Ascidiimonas meishanensis TaxID=3128903 RepID=UPI0030ECE50F